MWAGGKDINEKGESVLLLQPNSKKPNKKNNCGNPSASFLGGTPCFFEHAQIDHPVCNICGKEMYLIIQMNAPFGDLDRTMYVFGCNTASCMSAIFSSETKSEAERKQNSKIISSSSDEDQTGSRFCIGGGGVIRCIRSQAKTITEPEPQQSKQKDTVKQSEPKWGDDMDWGDADAGGWGDENDGEDSWGNEVLDGGNAVDDLEAMLSAMESGNNEKKSTKMGSKKKSQSAGAPESVICPKTLSSFLRYDLDVFDEPLSTRSKGDGDYDSDDEDVTNENSDDKVQQLLSKYLKEEEDEDILSAIKGGAGNVDGNSAGGASTGGGEKYERLPPADRAFMFFTTRVKRAPKQSARYAYDGIPLWSIPLPLTKAGKRGGRSRDFNFPANDIPLCSCGSHRSFEFQVMPSILHTLNVDRLQSTKKGDNIDLVMRKDSGGMNWGTIAVYSCAVSCENSAEEYVVIQESVDANPKERQIKKAAADEGEED